MILHIEDKGDPSVGIWPTSWCVQAPFDEKMDDENKKWFKERIKEIYYEFSEGKLILEYDYELKRPDDDF